MNPKSESPFSSLYSRTSSVQNGMDCYWYHSDHLGSSSWITYSDGEAVEHLHYMPWSEDFVQQRKTDFHPRYTFSAKEKDAETDYSYFGARYYSSDLSIWLSIDPMSDKYPSLSPYAYCQNNPVNRIDPVGTLDDWVQNKETGEYFWDDNIDSEKSFNESNYNKDKFSYAGKEFQVAYSSGSTGGSYTQYYGADGKTSIHDYPMWVTQGEQHIGLTEGGNATIQAMIDNHNSRIGIDYGFDIDGTPISSDSDPWCGVFVYNCLSESGQSVTSSSWKTPAKNDFYSKNWKEGSVISNPKIGAIAVMKYGHVAMVVGYNDKSVWILGGNQPRNGAVKRDGVEVNITKYKRSLVSTYVIPTGYNAPPLGTFK